MTQINPETFGVYGFRVGLDYIIYGMTIELSPAEGQKIRPQKALSQLETRMFQFLFKYPSSVFTKGRLVLLSGASGSCPCCCGSCRRLALLIRRRVVVLKLSCVACGWVGYGPCQRLLALLLLLLWQATVIVSELGRIRTLSPS